MIKDLNKLRREYSGELLDEKKVDKDPLKQFAFWFREALDTQIEDPHAMTLATASKDGIPGARVVLLKDFDRNGFTFYTHYHSRKGKELEHNPHVSLLFYWPQLFRQIRIDGIAFKIDPLVSEKYFKERPKGSQISAWISPQSNEVDTRDHLEKRYEEFEKACLDKEVPYPSFWGGFCVKPMAFEFWQGQNNRLHDRITYTFHPEEEAGWLIKRLAP